MADELYKAVTESISFGLHYALPVALIASSLGACKGGLARDDAAAGWVGPLRWGGLVCMHTKPQKLYIVGQKRALGEAVMGQGKLLDQMELELGVMAISI